MTQKASVLDPHPWEKILLSSSTTTTTSTSTPSTAAAAAAATSAAGYTTKQGSEKRIFVSGVHTHKKMVSEGEVGEDRLRRRTTTGEGVGVKTERESPVSEARARRADIRSGFNPLRPRASEKRPCESLTD